MNAAGSARPVGFSATDFERFAGARVQLVLRAPYAGRRKITGTLLRLEQTWGLGLGLGLGLGSAPPLTSPRTRTRTLTRTLTLTLTRTLTLTLTLARHGLLYRSAGALVAARAAIPPRPLLTAAELRWQAPKGEAVAAPGRPAQAGLVVVGLGLGLGLP